MTITVPLSPEEEAKLVALAEGRGLSPDALIGSVVKEILESAAPLVSNERLRSDEGEKRLKELFDSFDRLDVPADVSEEVFHRKNWYR